MSGSSWGGAQDLPTGLPRSDLRPCLLLLLAEGARHGYELLEQVAGLGLDRVDAGGLYRCLRSMEEEGLLRSEWGRSASGPARRTYELSERARTGLHVTAGSLDDVARSLDGYRRRYEHIAERFERLR